MMKVDDYIPVELCHEAKDFIKEISGDVLIFNQFRKLEKNISEEALKFAAWWEFGRYLDNRHSLVLLYENIMTIYETVGKYEVMNGFDQLQFKLILFYRLLKKHGMIDE
ncbi:MAG: hypothetical protein IKX70_07430 [Treponema sp.]|nr:hypothetical protein [Treponema sp.]